MTASVPSPGPAFEAGSVERRAAQRDSVRWIGWRRNGLVLFALFGCLWLFVLAHTLVALPVIDARGVAGPTGELVLRGSPDGAVMPPYPVIVGISAGGSPPVRVDAALLHTSPRWLVDDAQRARLVAQHEGVAALLARPETQTSGVRLHAANGDTFGAPVHARGYAGLGLLFWPLAGVALLLYLFGAVVLMAAPRAESALFALMSLCQAGTLLCIAIEAMPGLGLSAGIATHDMPLRAGLDLATGAAAVHVFALHPRRLARARTVAWLAWLCAASVTAVVLLGRPQAVPFGSDWVLVQLTFVGFAAAALATLHRSLRLEPNPRTRVTRRLVALALGTLVLVSVAVGIAERVPSVAANVAAGASLAWYLFLASLLMLTPFLARSRQLLREFAMLAGISTVATSLDLLFISVFSIGPFASLAIAVFLALGLYAGARQWILNHVIGTHIATTERAFDQIYRTARDLRARPERYPQLLDTLLRELFEPLEVLRVARNTESARAIDGGAALVVPLREAADGADAGAIVLRFARRGQRLFTPDDARLADRVLDQLRRAVRYDRAVERGRHEERVRIAQDLHDDIGARLLTLMYQAQTPEMEDYIRHTLQDLKTLTRGLAAAEHRLSHAAGEWKADLTQRLTVANIKLGWSFAIDQDPPLTVVQWSALTRVLRELVSNAVFHGRASHIDVSFVLERAALILRVADDGVGRAPAGWAHGLGLGGVRKRVKSLGGEVEWRENAPRGIVCTVKVAQLLAPD